MGISGLLPNLKSIIVSTHVREYAGLKVAVDTYSWLHKAAFSCSKDICEGRAPYKFIQYCMHRVNLLRHHGVQPILVFDGGVLPMKLEQEEKRAKARRENFHRAQEHERSGNQSAAFECYQRAVDITPAIALKLIQVLQQECVQYIVAPYEADAQMAYLALTGLVEVVITEDSDLIAYGCPRVLFKMDKSGQGEEFQFSDLVRNKDLNFMSFTKQMVLEMCILSGCDYLASLPGMGVKKAHGLIRKHKTYEKLRFSGISIPPDYEEKFRKASLTFHHQRVYDPVTETMVHLTSVPNAEDLDLDFLGPYLSEAVVQAIAVGRIDPCTKATFQETGPDVDTGNVQNIGRPTTERRRSLKRSDELLVQKNVMTNYFFSSSKEAKKQFKAPRTASERENRSDCDSFYSSLKTDWSPPDLLRVFGTPLPDDENVTVDRISQGPTLDDKKMLSTPEVLNQTRATNCSAFQDNPPIKFVPGMGGKEDGMIPVSEKAGRGSKPCSSQSILPKTSSGEKSWLIKERKIPREATKPKVSQYFSSNKTAHESLDKKEESGSYVSELLEGSSDEPAEQISKRSRVIPCDHFDEVFSGNSLPTRNSFDGEDQPVRRSTSDSCLELNQKQVLPFSQFLHNGLRSNVNFATNVEHVSHYARVAESSVQRFAESIASHRFSSRGSKVSGLRAPSKLVPAPGICKRDMGKDESSSKATLLNQFLFKSSSCKSARVRPDERPPRLVTSHDVRRQDI